MPRTISSNKRKLPKAKCPACGRKIALSEWYHYWRHNNKDGEPCHMSGRRWRSEYGELHRQPEHVCQACGLPEDGVQVRNVSPRPCGQALCADCTALSVYLEDQAAEAPIHLLKE